MLSNIIKNNRLTLYFSPRRDKDLRQNIEKANISEHGDLGDYIKELIRDGIKYRERGINNIVQMPIQQTHAPLQTADQFQNTMEKILTMSVQRKALDEQEAEDRFDLL